MADYNVNMKQWNGTSFDNVLPLAYNAKQLGGQSLAEVKQWVQDNNLLLYTGQYTGTGTYGKSNPVSIQFPFEPKLFIFPISTYDNYPASSPLDTSFLTTSYKQVGRVFYVNDRGLDVYGVRLLARFSDSSRKKLQIYSTESVADQSNKSGEIYYFAAIGGYDMGGLTEWIITSSGSWTVPKTGRYMLELYGGGGGTPRLVGKSGYTGGSSCQHYDSVSLTAGTSFNVTIGEAGVSSASLNEVTGGGSTTFGSYSVSGGGKATTSAAGSGAGNYGKSGIYVSGSTRTPTTNDGVLGSIKGVGSGGGAGSSGTSIPATAGAVYLKYLGA